MCRNQLPWGIIAVLAWSLCHDLPTVEAQQPTGRRPASSRQDYYHEGAPQPYGYVPPPQTSQFNPSVPYGGGYWTPGGYAGRTGSPYYYQGAPGQAYNGYGSNYPPAYEYQSGGAYPMGGSAAGWDMPAGNGGFAFTPLPANPYQHHFGPGHYRNTDYGHYRFPWYNYRSPWYYPGHPSYNRDTNLPW